MTYCRICGREMVATGPIDHEILCQPCIETALRVASHQGYEARWVDGSIRWVPREGAR